MRNTSLILLFICTSFFFCRASTSNIIEGIVQDTNGNPLAYVNIGLLNTPHGTVSEENGSFVFYLPEQYNAQDTLKFSIIGYKSEIYILNTITSPMKVVLAEEIITLNEIVVKPRFAQSKNIGLPKVKGNRNVNFAIADKPRQNLGAAIGTHVKVKNGVSQIESFHFYIRSNNFESAKFRVMLYTLKNGKPDAFLSNTDIIIEVKNKQTGWIEVDLQSFELLTDQDFIIALQWVDASTEGKRLAIPIKFPFFGKRHYYRFGSQAKWKRFNNMATSMYVKLAF